MSDVPTYSEEQLNAAVAEYAPVSEDIDVAIEAMHREIASLRTQLDQERQRRGAGSGALVAPDAPLGAGDDRTGGDMNDWQPIETAPTNPLTFTNRVLVAHFHRFEDDEGEVRQICRYRQVASLMPSRSSRGGEWCVDLVGCLTGGTAALISLHPQPTHWMPLPEPPEVT